MRPAIEIRMSWKMDGRRGVAKSGSAGREGFALMRNPEKNLIAFQAFPTENSDASPSEPTPRDGFVIYESEFEPRVA